MSRRWRARGGYVLLLLSIAVVGFLVPTLLAQKGSGQPGAATSKALAAGPSGQGYQELAALTTSHQVFAAPGAHPFEQVSATRPITGEQTVVPVMSIARNGGAEWLKVQLPGRPNGLTGWIEPSGTKLEYTRWRIVVNAARRQVYAYDGGHMVRSFSAVVGAPATPTPRGEFFVEESVVEPQSTPFYPYALALSARSNVYQEFDGGPGQIAIHGLINIGGTPGTAATHGCIRLDTGDMTWLARHIEPGVPVSVS